MGVEAIFRADAVHIERADAVHIEHDLVRQHAAHVHDVPHAEHVQA